VFRPTASRGGGDAAQANTVRFSDTIRNNVYANIGLSILFGGEDN